MSYHVDNNYSANKSFENQGFYPGKTESANNKSGHGRYIQHKSPYKRSTFKVELARKTTFSYGKSDNSKKVFEGKKVVKSGVNQKIKDLNRKICQARSSREILRICAESKNDFNEVNIATAIHRLTKSKDF